MIPKGSFSTLSLAVGHITPSASHSGLPITKQPCAVRVDASDNTLHRPAKRPAQDQPSMSQVGLGKPACPYGGAEFRGRAKDLAQRLGEPVEKLSALCESLATANAARTAKPKLAARLLRDAYVDGGLEVALRALDAQARKEIGAAALDAVESAWRGAGLTQEKRVCFGNSVDARNRSELTAIATTLGCTIVTDEANATHVVRFDPTVDAVVSNEEYLRTLVVDANRQLALVHWWYRPESRDEWIPLERVEGAPPPSEGEGAWARPPLQPQWHVCCRWLRDAKVHNEFGDERDYVEEDEEEIQVKPEPKKRKRKKREDQVPPRRKFRVRVLSGERPANGSHARIDVHAGGLRVGADRPNDTPAAPVAVTTTPAPPALDADAFRQSTRLDRAACPEWFCGDASKTPAAFLAAKAWMVALAQRSNPDLFLTATVCRQRLGVDAASAVRLWTYLDAIGLVNGATPLDKRRRPKQPAPCEPPPSSDEGLWTEKRLKALVASASVAADWQTCAADVSRVEGGTVTPVQCCSKFVDLDPPQMPALRSAEVVIPPVVVQDDGRAALDALVQSRLDRLEDRVARLSDLERQLADDQAAQTVERARLAAEWAGVALNLEP